MGDGMTKQKSLKELRIEKEAKALQKNLEKRKLQKKALEEKKKEKNAS
jgi:hypothetical protein